MTVYQAETSINGAPGRIFEFLTQPGLLTRWLGGLVESRPLDDGVLKVGARSLEIVEEHGRRIEFESVVTAVEPGRLLEVNLTGSMGVMTSRYRLEANGTTTRLLHTFEARYKGLLRLVSPLFARAVQRKIEGDLARLRAAVEAE